MTMLQWRLRVGFAFAAVLGAVSCGGQATHSKGEPEAASGGSGGAGGSGSTNADSDGNADDGSTAESVVSAQSAQAASSSDSVGAGGTAGAGGSGGSAGIGGVGVAGGAGFGGGAAGTGGVGFGGGASAVVTTTSTSGGTMDWGDVPVPEACVTTLTEYWDNSACELQVVCAGAPVSAECSLAGEVAFCSCAGDLAGGTYILNAVNIENACPYAVAACLHAPPFEAGPYECTQTSDEHSPEGCFSNAECERDAVVGDVKLIEADVRSTRCTAGDSNWNCVCNGPIQGVRFDLPIASSMTPCFEARDWCGGEELELSGNRECSPNALSVDPDLCSTTLECKQPVVASGMEATMYQTEPLHCWRGADGRFECSCLSQGGFPVDAPDSESACYMAADICAGG